MTSKKIVINNIPSIIWGENSDKVYIFVHGKMSNKESAEAFAEIANSKGYQVLSFDLPAHGERTDMNYRCDIWNGIHDLRIISEYVSNNWKSLSLFGCSLGAYFSLHAYQDIMFDKCMFQSPILDMEYLINNMFLWFDVTEERLKREKEILTPIDVLSWDYYCYVKAHPINQWASPTYILFGSEDNLQNRSIMEDFALKNHCSLTVSEGSDHPFSSKKDSETINNWFNKCI